MDCKQLGFADYEQAYPKSRTIREKFLAEKDASERADFFPNSGGCDNPKLSLLPAYPMVRDTLQSMALRLVAVSQVRPI